MAILACARIGAVHSVVYAGLGKEALFSRIADAKASCLVTADVGYRRGKEVPVMRRILKAQLIGGDLGDTSALED